jgi:hypothetical protein
VQTSFSSELSGPAHSQGCSTGIDSSALAPRPSCHYFHPDQQAAVTQPDYRAASPDANRFNSSRRVRAQQRLGHRAASRRRRPPPASGAARPPRRQRRRHPGTTLRRGAAHWANTTPPGRRACGSFSLAPAAPIPDALVAGTVGRPAPMKADLRAGCPARAVWKLVQRGAQVPARFLRTSAGVFAVSYERTRVEVRIRPTGERRWLPWPAGFRRVRRAGPGRFAADETNA